MPILVAFSYLGLHSSAVRSRDCASMVLVLQGWKLNLPLRSCRVAFIVCLGLAWLAGIGFAQELATSPPLPPVPATISNREGDLEKRLHEMERTNRELAGRLDAAQ